MLSPCCEVTLEKLKDSMIAEVKKAEEEHKRRTEK